MGQETLRDLKVDFTNRSDVVQEFSQSLSCNFERVATAGSDYSSLILVGGAGFGDFNIQSSDIDAWLIMRDFPPEERLQKARELNTIYEAAKEAVLKEGTLKSHNFRHPPTLLSEAESVGYRKAFSAKVGLPISLGVFPTLSGSDRKGEVCFTEEQLVRDLAYSCSVFQENLLHPPKNNSEDPLRYCYKRATYFLRFQLLYEKGLYVPRQELLLSAGEQNLPEWGPVIPMMWRVHDPSSQNQPDLLQFQDSVNNAMQVGMNRYWEDGVIDGGRITRGDIRTKIFWTLEKLRWDYLLLPRDEEILNGVMSDHGQKLWGFSYSQVDDLFGEFLEIVPDEETTRDWVNFKQKHKQVVSNQINTGLKDYYNQIYHPMLVSFFDRIIGQTDKLF